MAALTGGDRIDADAEQVQHAGLCRTTCAGAARQVTVTVMPTQGLAAMTEAVANDITGYFQRHAVVRARRAGVARGCMPIELYTALALQSTECHGSVHVVVCIMAELPWGTLALATSFCRIICLEIFAMRGTGSLTE